MNGPTATRSGARTTRAVSRGCRVVVCAGCCCGSERKHPGVDHAALLHRLCERLGDRLQVSDCLGACAYSNVAVVSPSATERARGARPVWVGWLLDEESVDDLAAWVQGGGPGARQCPAGLELARFRPPRGARSARP